MRRAQAVRKSREIEERDSDGRCKGWSGCSSSSKAGVRRTDVEEDWGAAGVLLMVLVLLSGMECISRWRG